MSEYRRILLEGCPTTVTVSGGELVAPDGRAVAATDAIHLPPSTPSKIICVHLNHRSRVEEFMATLPAAPTYFHKPTSSLLGHRGHVVRPERCRYLNYEGEVVIVIGRPCRNVSPAEAGEYIAGYTIGNDFGLHDFRDTDAGSMLRVKGTDTMCPVGPGLVEGLGLPEQAAAHAGERRGAPGGQHGGDDVGHALPRGRPGAHDHAAAG